MKKSIKNNRRSNFGGLLTLSLLYNVREKNKMHSNYEITRASEAFFKKKIEEQVSKES